MRKSNIRRGSTRNVFLYSSSMKLPLELVVRCRRAGRPTRGYCSRRISHRFNTPLLRTRLHKLWAGRDGYYPPMFAIPTLCLDVSVVFFGTVDMIHYTQYLLLYICTVQYCCTSAGKHVVYILYLVYIMASRDYLNSVATRRYTRRCRSGWWPAWMKYAQESRLTTLCSVSRLLIPGSLLVAAGCSLCVPLAAITAIENSRQGSPFPNTRHD